MTAGESSTFPAMGCVCTFYSWCAVISLLSVSTTREGAGTADTAVPGQIRLAARTPCNKWAGALPPRGARSREALAGLWLPETRPHRPKNRLGVTASGRAGGRRAGPGPPGSLLRRRPSKHSCLRVAGAAPETRRAPGSELAPGQRLPTPTQPHAAAPPAGPPFTVRAGGRARRRKQERGLRRRPRLCLAAPTTASRLPGRSGPGPAGQPLTQEAPRPAAASLQLCGGPRPAGNPRRPGAGSTGEAAGRGAAGPGGGGRRGAYLPWCCRGAGGRRSRRLVAGRTGRGEGARPVRRRGGSGVAVWGALIAAVTWPRTLRALGRSLPTQGPRGQRPPAPRNPGCPSASLPLGLGSGSSSPAPPGVVRWGTCRGPRASPPRDLGGDSRADGSISGNKLSKKPRVRGT